MTTIASFAALTPASHWLAVHPNWMFAMGLALGGFAAALIYFGIKLYLVRMDRQRGVR